MVDLVQSSGLPVSWHADSERMLFGEKVIGESPEPAIRTCQDMIEVLSSGSCEGYGNLYYMYRGMSFAGDRELIKKAGLRYDITVIRPGEIGSEYIKTAGHYHPEKAGSGLTWPELYEVLYGVAHYLLQKPLSGHNDRLQDIIVVEARAGDKVLIPPGYGHITINPGKTHLIMSNWVAGSFASLYAPIKEMKGGGYFELASNNASEFVPNRNYKDLPVLKYGQPVAFEALDINPGMPMYSSLFTKEDAFRYLTVPENYLNLFQSYLNKLSTGKIE